MKSAATGTVSGCIIWFIVVAIAAMCLLPLAVSVGATTSDTDLAVKTTAPYVCPRGTTGHVHTYEGMTPDENGFDTPATISELQCLDAGGSVVYTDPIEWGLIWLGIIAAAALVISVILGFVLAAPAGLLVARFLNRTKATQV